MPAKKKTTRRTKSLGTRFKQNPVTTTVNEAKKLGIPKPVTKFALLGIGLGLLAPSVSQQADRIPFMNIATNAGRNLRARLLTGMRNG